MAYAVWMTGLPGSGKSTIAKELVKMLKNVRYLRLDEIRNKFIKTPNFTEEERGITYNKFVEEGLMSVESGKNVIYDAAAHRLKWRMEARSKIADFMEVYVSCPIEVCVERESKRKDGLVAANLYKKAMERKRTGKQFEGLGQVVGVDVPYEEDPGAEVRLDSSLTDPKMSAKIVYDAIKKKGWI